jgi:DNA polymerase alpha subunit A
MQATGKSVRALDTIPYVVCEDGTTNAATQRAYHPDDLRKQAHLKIDVEYYLKNQVCDGYCGWDTITPSSLCSCFRFTL